MASQLFLADGKDCCLPLIWKEYIFSVYELHTLSFSYYSIGNCLHLARDVLAKYFILNKFYGDFSFHVNEGNKREIQIPPFLEYYYLEEIVHLWCIIY